MGFLNLYQPLKILKAIFKGGGNAEEKTVFLWVRGGKM